MTDFERELRQTLRRRDPARDLTAGIMARVSGSRRPKRRWTFGFEWRPILAATAVVAMLAAGLDRYREYQRGQEAKRELILALRITAKELARVNEKIDELNRRSIYHER
jgi:anti-sigma-K factor RskA